METLKKIWANRWIKFAVVSVIYILIFVVWPGNLWLLLGLPIIYDRYISKIFYRYVWSKHKAKKATNRLYRSIMDWVDAIVFAVVVVTLLKAFVFGMFVIPTPSMERSLMVGDYLLVSKLRYGPVVPNTPFSLPLVHNTMPFSSTKKSYSEKIKWDYHRLKGLGKVKRGDVVVFNFPAGDTVVLENQAAVYYDILRGYQANYGREAGRKKLYEEYTVISRPVDKRENYVKRCVGLPGDTIKVVESQLVVNSKPLDVIDGLQHYYAVRINGTPINQNTFREMGIAQNDIYYSQESAIYEMPLTEENLKRVEGMRNVVSVRKYVAQGANSAVFPQGVEHAWNEDNYGPLWVPRKGATVVLTVDNLPLYRTIIENYELHKVDIQGDVILIDGQAVEKYTFEMDYFFMMGDNRHNSSDSRFWGFVPEDHVVGKASFIWMSTDKERGSFPLNIRWSRLLKKIK